MTQDGKKRRGRRRGRREEPGRSVPPADPQEPQEELDIEAQSDVPGVMGSRFSFRRRRTGDTPDKRPPRSQERAASSASPSSSSPMDFWRSGQARTYRDPRTAQKKMGIWQRISGFHFPAWMPVATIMIVVMVILGGLFLVQSARGAPRIGDHWHAPYAIFIGDELQPRIQTVITDQGIHTHGDGMVHVHPHSSVAEGSGARLEYFFRDQGGTLSDSEMQIPGRDETYKNGDTLEGDDRPSELRILRADSGFHPLGNNFPEAILACNDKPEAEFERISSRYVPQDGDCIRIIFAPPEVQPVVEPDRTIIDPATADREVKMEVSGAGATTVFSPASIEVSAGETVRVVLTNRSTEATFHGLRFSGADRAYDTSDDYVTDPPTIDPGQSGTAVIKYDTPGEYEFKDEQALEGVAPVTGKVIVGEAEATPAPGVTATPTPVTADVTVDVEVADSFFTPTNVNVPAEKRFLINLTNTGALIHSLCVAGPDGEPRTADDIVCFNVGPGQRAQAAAQINQPGVYEFVDTFHPTEAVGTITVE